MKSAAMLLALVIAGCGTADMSEDEKAARIAKLYAGHRGSFPEAPELTVEDLLGRLEASGALVLVDVRTEEEQAISMIPGAISRQEFEQRREALQGRTVVTYCTIGYRSGLLAQEMFHQGWDVYNLAGSILAWTHAGQPLEKSGEDTRRLHVYGRRWDLAADDYETVW